MHECLKRSRHESVIDEEIFFDAQAGVAPLEVAGAIVFDAMAKDQILRPGGRADGICLHELHAVDGALERDRREEAVSHRLAAEVV